jgi:uncharacterized DUF497 family protein
MDKYVSWDEQKNALLKQTRNISFEDVMVHILGRTYLDIIDHPNAQKYAHQRQFIVVIKDYVYLVPFIEDEEKIFLKTIIPSRKATKTYGLKQGNTK